MAKHTFNFQADYDFKVEERNEAAAAEEMSRLMRLLASYGFMVETVRMWFDDEEPVKEE